MVRLRLLKAMASSRTSDQRASLAVLKGGWVGSAVEYADDVDAAFANSVDDGIREPRQGSPTPGRVDSWIALGEFLDTPDLVRELMEKCTPQTRQALIVEANGPLRIGRCLSVQMDRERRQPIGHNSRMSRS